MHSITCQVRFGGNKFSVNVTEYYSLHFSCQTLSRDRTANRIVGVVEKVGFCLTHTTCVTPSKYQLGISLPVRMFNIFFFGR